MSDHPIIAEEIALHEQVREHLAAGDGRPSADEAPLVRELLALREQLINNPEGKDATTLRDQWHRQSALLSQLRAGRDRSQVDPRSPYFAHLRLREGTQERDLCLGRATRIESGLRIVDWRNAPISRIFYRYQQGEEYSEEFAGRLREGIVAARRTVHIQDAVLDRIDAPEGIFLEEPMGWRRLEGDRAQLSGGEASAFRAHAPEAGSHRRMGTNPAGALQRTDKHLPEITSLIDPAQFELISRSSSGFVAIRGSAGSGKTTVALHRIAYLAYADPEVDSARSLFVVFSPALRNYVAHVLPALGVEDVRIVTFREWVSAQRQRHFPRLPREVRDDAPSEAQALLLHPGCAAALAQHVAEHPGPATPERALDDWGSVLGRSRLLREFCGGDGPEDLRPEAIRRVADWNRRRQEEIFAWIQGDEHNDAALCPEDEALLLRAWQLRVGPLRERGKRPLRYRHVAVDEVQDFAPVEVQVLLGCLDRNQSLTLAGDDQQRIARKKGFTSWSTFLQGLGVEGEEVETLRVSYRSPREIVHFARGLLGDLAEDEAPETPRSGSPVELFRFSDRGACVIFLCDVLRELARVEPLASVAILTPNSDSSQLYHEGLLRGEIPGLHRVIAGDFSFAPGVEVTEVEQSKGLEFDYVVLVDVTPDHYPDEPHARRLLHVGASRAVHQLWLSCVGTPSSLVAGVEQSHG